MGRVLNVLTQRTVSELRAEVEAKIHRLPLRYFDGNQRGDLLSRVTNDLDNVSQSLQQTIAQVLNSVLTVIAILVMMVWISPLLSLIAIVTIPLAVLVTAMVAKRSKPHFMAQWSNTGRLNGQVEEAFSGHELIKAFGRQEDVERRFDERNEKLYSASWRAQFISGIIMPAIMFLGNLNYVAIAVVGGLRVAVGFAESGRCAGIHPVLAAVHPAADPDRVDGQPDAERRGLGRADLRHPRCRGTDPGSGEPESPGDQRGAHHLR